MPQQPKPWQSDFESKGSPHPGAQRGGGRADDAAAAPEVALRFEPENVVRGIVFHVVDEGIAKKVSPESADKALARLRRRAVRPSIRRSAWLAMTNHERLEWLLAETGTIPLIQEDDVALLAHREA